MNLFSPDANPAPLLYFHSFYRHNGAAKKLALFRAVRFAGPDVADKLLADKGQSFGCGADGVDLGARQDQRLELRLEGAADHGRKL